MATISETSSGSTIAALLARRGRDVLLVRPETKPDDVHGMLAARGVRADAIIAGDGPERERLAAQVDVALSHARLLAEQAGPQPRGQIVLPQFGRDRVLAQRLARKFRLQRARVERSQRLALLRDLRVRQAEPLAAGGRSSVPPSGFSVLPVVKPSTPPAVDPASIGLVPLDRS